MQEKMEKILQRLVAMHDNQGKRCVGHGPSLKLLHVDIYFLQLGQDK